MDWSNPWIIGPLCAGLGVLIGMLLMRYVVGGGPSERALEELRGEFDEYRGKVKDHFETTSELFQDMTEKYRDVYNHLAVGAQDFGNSDDTPARLEIIHNAGKLAAAGAAVDVAVADETSVEPGPVSAPGETTDEAEALKTEEPAESDADSSADDQSGDSTDVMASQESEAEPGDADSAVTDADEDAPTETSDDVARKAAGV